MKLSEVRGERVFDLIADIIEPVAAIVSSDEFKAITKRQEAPEGMTGREFMVDRIRRSLPSLIRTQKDNVVAVLAAIDGKTPQEYMDGMTLVSLYADVTELLGDEVFQDFFVSVSQETES